MSEYHRFNLDKAIQFAVEGVKAALVLNGGAAVAVLGLLGAVAAKDKVVEFNIADLRSALTTFGTGMVAAALTFVAAYISQLGFAQHAGAQPGKRARWIGGAFGQVFRVAGLAGVGLSLWWFYEGVRIAAGSFKLATP